MASCRMEGRSEMIMVTAKQRFHKTSLPQRGIQKDHVQMLEKLQVIKRVRMIRIMIARQLSETRTQGLEEAGTVWRVQSADMHEKNCRKQRWSTQEGKTLTSKKSSPVQNDTEHKHLCELCRCCVPVVAPPDPYRCRGMSFAPWKSGRRRVALHQQWREWCSDSKS